ncbi:MAG: pilus assembly protein TadG-related protein [Chloroflexota bacterium]|nr:pilus assembly protein TadG-related protein [Chloroflexota bacterium]
MRVVTIDRRKGVVGVWVAVSMLALLGMAALVIDLGRVSVAAQQVQAIVDAAALAGTAKLPTQSDAEGNLQRTISANNMLNTAWMVSCVPSNDVVYYGPGKRCRTTARWRTTSTPSR